MNTKKLIKRSGLFDERYYLKTYKDVRALDVDPLSHFIKYGWREGRNPSAEFDTTYYLTEYEDVKSLNINPLLHYIKYGQKEGKLPKPQNDQEESARIVKASGLFDEEYYLDTYVDVKMIGMDPVKHYLEFGWKEGRNPSAEFDTQFYLSEYKDVKEAGINPLLHYIKSGKEEGRAPKKNRYDIVVLTTPHTLFVAHLICETLKKHDKKTTIVLHQDTPLEYDECLHIVICPQMFSNLPSQYIAYQMEQSVSSRWFTEEYFQILRNSLAIFEYSKRNIEFLLSHDIAYKQIFYMPIAYFDNFPKYLRDNGYWDGSRYNDETDIVFYGDPKSLRRKRFLEALQKKFNVKVVAEVYGNDLYKELMSAKLVVNIHYYEGALLETTRIYECLSLGIPIVSETSVDIDEHKDLLSCIDFTPIDDIEAMIESIENLLVNPRKLQERKESIKAILSEKGMFEFYFDRFMYAYNMLSLDALQKHKENAVKVSESNMVCLGLPESVKRRKSFLRDNKYKIEIFDGMRHQESWIGCASSYKYLMQTAMERGLEYIIICEDDVEFDDAFESRLDNILKYLQSTENKWHVFAGLIADLHPETNILKIEEFEGEEFIYIDKMTSMVFNIYHKSIFPIIAKWDESDTDVHTNTIDRYIESHTDVVTVTTLPYLVGHKEEEDSTIWGFNNTTYSELIQKSRDMLSLKVKLYKEKIVSEENSGFLEK